MKRFHILFLALIMLCRIGSVIAEDAVITVYKSPTCGCCDKWITHLEQNGFKVVAHNEANMPKIKSQYDIAFPLQSCHTGVVDGYFIEGHVPAKDIKKLLTEKPAIKGLSVPGMPAGSNVPGMETKAEKASFDVLAVGDDGTEVFAHYE